MYEDVKAIVSFMVSVCLLKVFLNDMSHAMFGGNTGKQGNMGEERLYSYIKGITGIDIPVSVVAPLAPLNSVCSAYDIASFLFKVRNVKLGVEMLNAGKAYAYQAKTLGFIDQTIMSYIETAHDEILDAIRRQDFNTAYDKASDVSAAMRVVHSYLLVGRMKSRGLM